MKSVITNSIKERKAVISLLLDFNFRWHGEDWDIEEIERQFPHKTWPVVMIRDIELGDKSYIKNIAGTADTQNSISFLEFISFLNKTY